MAANGLVTGDSPGTRPDETNEFIVPQRKLRSSGTRVRSGERDILLFRHDMTGQLQCTFRFPARHPRDVFGRELVGHNGKAARAASGRVPLNVKHA